MCSIRLTVGRSVVTSISSAAEDVLRVTDDKSFSPEDEDDDVEYRPSTRPERHHAPTRWRGTSPALLLKHRRRGATPPAAKITSRADKDDLSLPLPRDDDGVSSYVSIPPPPADVASNDADKAPSAAVVTPSVAVVVVLAAEADEAAGGNDAAPRPPLAMLPSIHIACSRTAPSSLDNNDTIVGTASA
jgi:hypothetical protein